LKTIGETSADARFLYQEIIKVSIGDAITYKALSGLIGRDVQDEARGALMTARRIAERDKNIVFGVIRDVGLKRLNDAEIVSTGEDARGRIRRIARRSVARVLRVNNYAELSQEDKVRHNAYASLFGAIEQMASPKSIAKLEQYAKDAQAELPIKRTLELFAAEK
jgi:hypothetical protein